MESSAERKYSVSSQKRIAGISIFVLLLMLLVLYRETVDLLVVKWNSEYAHGYLVVLISIYLIFRRRKVLATLTPYPNASALILVGIFSFSWLLAAVADVLLIQSISLLMLIFSISWVALGTQIIRQLIVPILFLVFALPIWSVFSPFLQQLTSESAYTLLRLSDVPAFLHGQVIYLPSGQFSIDRACSGLSYLLTALTLSILYVHMYYQGLSKQIFGVAVATSAAIIANILRVYFVVYMGHMTEMQHPWVDDHLNLGWYIFTAVVVTLLIIDGWIHRRNDSAYEKQEYAEYVPSPEYHGESKTSLYILIVVFAAVLVSSAPGFAALLKRTDKEILSVEMMFPEKLDVWKLYEDTDDDWEPFFQGAISRKVEYRDHAGVSIYVYAGHYPSQGQGKEVINDLNKIEGKKEWKTSGEGVEVLTNSEFGVYEQRIKKYTGQSRLVWYWYEVAGWRTASPYKAKVFQILGALVDNTHASVVAVATDVGEDVAETRNRLHGFINYLDSERLFVPVSQ